jgi:tRNA-dihydrouridine synthase B
MIEHYGYQVGISLAKKHIGWYSSGLKDSAEFRATINCCGSYSNHENNQQYYQDSYQEMQNLIDKFYQSHY